MQFLKISQFKLKLMSTMASASIPSVLEPSGIYRSDGKRPDGMTLLPWSKGRSLLWDFTCPDTLAPSHLTSTCISAGAAALKAERRKEVKYNDRGYQLRIFFNR